jgi:hypothetical protein
MLSESHLGDLLIHALIDLASCMSVCMFLYRDFGSFSNFSLYHFSANDHGVSGENQSTHNDCSKAAAVMARSKW